jgi:hypothetical protein
MRLTDKEGLYNVLRVMREVNKVDREVCREWRKDHENNYTSHDKDAEVKRRICKKLLTMDFSGYQPANATYYEMMNDFIVYRAKWKVTEIYYVGSVANRYNATYEDDLRGYRINENVSNSVNELHRCVWMDECTTLETALEIRKEDYLKGLDDIKVREIQDNIEWDLDAIREELKKVRQMRENLTENKATYEQYKSEVVLLEEWVKTCPVDIQIKDVTHSRRNYILNHESEIKQLTRLLQSVATRKTRVTERTEELNKIVGEEE